MKKLVILSFAFFSSFAFADCSSDVASMGDSIYDEKVFDWKFYAHNNTDLIGALGGNEAAIKQHWRTNGICEGRQASNGFSSTEYLARYGDLRGAFGNNYGAAMKHYLYNGFAERRLARVCEAIPASIKFSIVDGRRAAVATYADGSTKKNYGDSFPIYCTDKPTNKSTQRVKFDVKPLKFQGAGDHFGVILEMSASKNNSSGYYLGRGFIFFSNLGVFREYFSKTTVGTDGLGQLFETSNYGVSNQLPSQAVYPSTTMQGDIAYSADFASSGVSIPGVGGARGNVSYNGLKTYFPYWDDGKTAHPYGASGVNFFAICPTSVPACLNDVSVEFRNISVVWED
ncbi:hypothetical protein [Acidovorax sp. 1608163]|uniref:hypothetical protein n=1 Tax=Acidovorax sp. 1608163 TaxID=2478662 RepID=UPI0013CE76D5|nr:hypothetical protein [Acidovorax sp. 1608163]